jgi:hypothetical protein
MCAELSAVKNSMKTISISVKVYNYRLDFCNDHRTCETVTSNKTIEIPVAADLQFSIRIFGTDG